MSILKTKNHSSAKLQNLKKTLTNPTKIISMNVLVEGNLHKKFKIKSAMNGVTMTDVVLEAIREYVK